MKDLRSSHRQTPSAKQYGLMVNAMNFETPGLAPLKNLTMLKLPQLILLVGTVWFQDSG